MRRKLPTSIDLRFGEALKSDDSYQQSNNTYSELSRLIRSVDSLIVTQPSELSRLLGDMASSASNASNIVESVVEYCVFDFSDSDSNLAALGALDDVVMGGVSQGSFFVRDEQAIFAGNVSTDNSGGFSSVRTKNFDPPFDFEGWQGLRLWVKGDGSAISLFRAIAADGTLQLISTVLIRLPVPG